MRFMRFFAAFVLAGGVFAAFASAQATKGLNPDAVVVAPGAPVFTGTGSPGPESTLVAPVGVESSAESGLNTIFRSLPRTYQEYIASSNLSAISQPSYITGMQVRLAIGENWRTAGYVGATWPSQNLSFASYSVTLAKPSAGLVSDGEYLSLAPTFASYQVSPTVVRSGPLTINAGAYTADGGPAGVHSFGPVVGFTTPYAFTPGDGLIVQINHGGYSPATELNAFFASRFFENGVADAVSSTASGTAAAPGGFSSPYFIQFTYEPIPEPAGLGALAVMGALALRRRNA